MSTKLMKFHNTQMERLEIHGRHCFTAEAIGSALRYSDPRKNINTLFNRNSDEFEKNFDYGDVKLTSPGGIQQVRVFFQTGVNLIGMFSGQPLAKEFRRWAKMVLANIQVDPEIQRLTTMEIPMTEYVGLLKSRIEYLESKVNKPKRRNSRPLTSEVIEQIKLLKDEGLSQKQIAEQTGRSRATISYVSRGLI